MKIEMRPEKIGVTKVKIATWTICRTTNVITMNAAHKNHPSASMRSLSPADNQASAGSSRSGVMRWSGRTVCSDPKAPNIPTGP